jgi:hypothetical protein
MFGVRLLWQAAIGVQRNEIEVTRHPHNHLNRLCEIGYGVGKAIPMAWVLGRQRNMALHSNSKMRLHVIWMEHETYNKRATKPTFCAKLRDIEGKAKWLMRGEPILSR